MAVVEGQIVFKRHEDGRVEILEAPPIARMSLELVQRADPAVFRVRGSDLTFAGRVTYRVTGWDHHGAALVLERIGGET